MFILMLFYTILLAILSTCLFTHSQYNKNNFIQTMVNILTFKKMLMNKTISSVNPIIVKINFFLFMVISIFCIQIGYGALYTDPLSDYLIILFLWAIVWLVLVFILRLVFELIIIPLVTQNNNAIPQNMYMQNIPPQFQQTDFTNTQPNTTYVQQPQQNIYNPAQPQTVAPNTSTIAPPSKTNYAFCSQCGTCYNPSEGKCPKCGMQ